MDLKEIVDDLKLQIIRATSSSGEDGMFILKECEVELGLELTEDASGKVEFKLFGVGAEGGAGAGKKSSLGVKSALITKTIICMTKRYTDSLPYRAGRDAARAIFWGAR